MSWLRMHRATGLAGVLAVLPWLILAVGPGWMMAVSAFAPDLTQDVLTVSLAAFFLLLVARLGFAASRQPKRRPALLLMLVAVLTWGAGSAMLNGSGQPDLTDFPARGELLFLASYAGMAGFLVLDAVKRRGTASATWFETAVICGGSACLAGAVLVTPAAQDLGRDGLPLLLALLYPLIDIVLGLLVVSQIVLRTRAGLRESGGLLLGFALFAIADSGFLVHLSQGTYDYNLLSVVLWGSGFALIVGNACKPRGLAVARPAGDSPTTLVVLAGITAGFVLALQPQGTIRDYLVVPALGTLIAAGFRLALALRAANKASEAIALSRSDDLTGLPNRRAMLARLDVTLDTDQPCGLMILDLDGFKDVNDTLGHAAGDAVLCEVAVRVRDRLDQDVMFARLGGDEFAVVAGTADEIDLMEMARAVLDVIREPLEIDGILLTVDASIGIATRTVVDRHHSDLLRRADVAMYTAKRRRAGALLYDADSDDFSRDRLRLGDELRRAIKERQLTLWYQPQIEAATGRVCGLEALVRWQHPTRGLLSPALFLPIARRAGLMQVLSEEIGRIAVGDLARWSAQGVTTRVALNCAPPELMSGIFINRLAAALDDAGIPAGRILVEVTEDSFMSEPERARAVLLDIRDRGFEVSIDDYGTGFSSLSYLRDLPVQELKIDRSFVATMLSDARSRMIIASTYQMAHALGLRVVAEGIEDAATSADLVAMGIDVLQGYHLGRPLPADEVVSWIRQSRAIIS